MASPCCGVQPTDVFLALQIDHEIQMVGCGVLGGKPVYIIKCVPCPTFSPRPTPRLCPASMPCLSPGAMPCPLPGNIPSVQCFAKCPFTCQFDRLSDQLCQSLDRLSDHFAKHCLRVSPLAACPDTSHPPLMVVNTDSHCSLPPQEFLGHQRLGSLWRVRLLRTQPGDDLQGRHMWHCGRCVVPDSLSRV